MEQKIPLLIKSHMDRLEEFLLARSNIPQTAGHPNNKGLPRESFISDFLKEHLPKEVAIGSGEIFDSRGEVGQARNQIDIILYKSSGPKLTLGGDVAVFPIESVLATIEVKSTLDKPSLSQAVMAARNLKRLSPSIIRKSNPSYHSAMLRSYLVSFAGPQNMMTAYNWLTEIHKENEIGITPLPQQTSERFQAFSPSLDGVFVLGKGFIYLDNTLAGLHVPREKHPESKWITCTTDRGSLLVFYLLMQMSTLNTNDTFINTHAYVDSIEFDVYFLP